MTNRLDGHYAVGLIEYDRSFQIAVFVANSRKCGIFNTLHGGSHNLFDGTDAARILFGFWIVPLAFAAFLRQLWANQTPDGIALRFAHRKPSAFTFLLGF